MKWLHRNQEKIILDTVESVKHEQAKIASKLAFRNVEILGFFAAVITFSVGSFSFSKSIPEANKLIITLLLSTICIYGFLSSFLDEILWRVILKVTVSCGVLLYLLKVSAVWPFL